MVKVHDNFSRFGFYGNYTIDLIDVKDILILLEHKDNYTWLFLKPMWYIDGCPMKIFK